MYLHRIITGRVATSFAGGVFCSHTVGARNGSIGQMADPFASPNVLENGMGVQTYCATNREMEQTRQCAKANCVPRVAANPVS